MLRTTDAIVEDMVKIHKVQAGMLHSQLADWTRSRLCEWHPINAVREANLSAHTRGDH